MIISPLKWVLYKQYEPQSCAQLLAPVYSALASSVEKLRDLLKAEPIRPPETPKKAPVKPSATKAPLPQGFKERLLQQWEDEMAARLAPPLPPPPADPTTEREPSPLPVIAPPSPPADIPNPPAAEADMEVEPSSSASQTEAVAVPELPKIEEPPPPAPEPIPEAPTPRRTISLADYLKRKSLAAASSEALSSVSVPSTPAPAVEEKRPSSPPHDKPHHHKAGPPPPYMLNVMDWTKRTEFDAVPPQSVDVEKSTAPSSQTE